MEPIRSGTTTERVIRTTILTALFVGYSLWSFWDGYYGYPNKNVAVLKENITPVPQTPPQINGRVVWTEVSSLHEKVHKDHQEVTEAEVVASLGEPAAREGDTSFFFGPGGMARIVFENGLVKQVKWFHGPKKESDLFTQFVIGYATGVLGLAMILQLIRVLITRAELTDAGLKVNSQGGRRWGGSPVVPFEAMTALRTDDYKKKGSVELEYRLDDGTEGTVSLNDYVHKAFPAIVGEICRRRGFENPMRQADGAGDEAEDSAAESAADDAARRSVDGDGAVETKADLQSGS